MILHKSRFAKALALLFAALTLSPALLADHTPDPSTVTVAGNLQSELGCPGDWQPDCAATHLGFDAVDEVWQGIFNIPAGSWEYKATLNDTWDESYPGANIPLTLGAPTDVKFYYDHETHWITDNQNSRIATAVGSFQSEIGCPGDWQPDCLRSWLQDMDGDGIYSFTTDQIPAGSYQFKVALDEANDGLEAIGGFVIATATASSKKLLAPISAPGAATLYGPFSHFINP